MRVTFGADDASIQCDGTGGAQDRNPQRTFMISADAKRQIDAQINAIRVAQLDLCVVARRAKDAHVGNDPLPWADERDKLLGSELALLIEVLRFRELGAGSK